jgi:hypothetical protein
MVERSRNGDWSIVLTPTKPVPFNWFLVACLLPPLIACASMGAALLLPGVYFSPDGGGG